MLKVVLDTNVLVSAILKPGSLPELVLSLVLSGKIVLCLSEPIAAEYEEVLKRPKFRKLDRRKVNELLSRIRAEARWVAPRIPLHVSLTDPEDNKFLECAVEAEADLLVTGNIKHFPSGKFRGTAIVNPARFLSAATRMLDL